MKPATNGGQYTLPPEPNRMPAILLALAVHALLLAFLWIGVNWQKAEPPAVEAEVWDMKVESAAAPALPPPPPPEVREPEPEPTPVPPAPVPKVAEPEPVKPAVPDINLEREKKLAEQKKQRELEKRELEKKEREELKAKELADKKAADKKLAEKKELEKKELEKKAEADKKLAADKLAADKKKLATDKAAKAKADAAEQAKLDKLRDEELKRMMGAAGSTGSAQKSSAPKIDASYQAAIASKVRSNTFYSGDTSAVGSAAAEFRIEQLPTGEILSIRKTKSSGIPAFDDAVEKGILKSSPLPKKKDGTVERSFPISLKLKDLE